jgi:two-component system NtrC family response regulator
MSASRKLLIVEDDPGLQRQLRWAYEGYEVFVAGDRDEALALLRAEAFLNLCLRAELGA